MTSYIYFIQANGDGPIKIGTTRYNPTRRMVKIQCDCPWPVRLLGAIEGTVSQEKQIHEVLDRYRTQGEWFEPNSIVLAAIETALNSGRRAVFCNAVPVEHLHPLRRYRKTHNPKLTQSDLAERLDVDRITILRWEKGQRNIDISALPDVSKKTGFSPGVLRPDLAEMFGEVSQ